MKPFRTSQFIHAIKDTTIQAHFREVQEYLKALSAEFSPPEALPQQDDKAPAVPYQPPEPTFQDLVKNTIIREMPKEANVAEGNLVYFNGNVAALASNDDKAKVPRGVIIGKNPNSSLFLVRLMGQCKIAVETTSTIDINGTLWMGASGMATGSMTSGSEFDCEIGWTLETISKTGLYSCYFKAPTIARYGF